MICSGNPQCRSVISREKMCLSGLPTIADDCRSDDCRSDDCRSAASSAGEFEMVFEDTAC
jgi:hypothetical protein